jgi:hypothetical protein
MSTRPRRNRRNEQARTFTRARKDRSAQVNSPEKVSKDRTSAFPGDSIPYYGTSVFYEWLKRPIWRIDNPV